MAAEPAAQEADLIEIRAPRFDLLALWRLTAWGGAAAAALSAVALVSQTESGRLRLALAAQELPVKPVATVKIPPRRQQDAEIKRLEDQVRTLAADRDRLAERVAGLEHNIEDLTGSIKRQAAQPAPASPPILSMAPAPAVSPPATTEAKEPDKPALPRRQAPAPPVDEAPPAAAEQAPPAHASAPHAAVPLPPVRVAAALATAPAPPKPEFGVALASASSLDVMRLQWVALKANYGPLLSGLRPIASREQRGSVTHYRLVAGPLPNYSAAARLCARLNAAHAVCHAGKFTGQLF
jgi:hypothetical protein